MLCNAAPEASLELPWNQCKGDYRIHHPLDFGHFEDMKSRYAGRDGVVYPKLETNPVRSDRCHLCLK